MFIKKPGTLETGGRLTLNLWWFLLSPRCGGVEAHCYTVTPLGDITGATVFFIVVRAVGPAAASLLLVYCWT